MKVNLKPIHDRLKSRCIVEGCNDKSRYGVHHGAALYCSKHKNSVQNNTFDLDHPICKCNKRASYGYDKPIYKLISKKNTLVFRYQYNPTHCAGCKEPGMVNVILRKCSVPKCKRRYSSITHVSRTMCRFHEIEEK